MLDIALLIINLNLLLLNPENINHTLREIPLPKDIPHPTVDRLQPMYGLGDHRKYTLIALEVDLLEGSLFEAVQVVVERQQAEGEILYYDFVEQTALSEELVADVGFFGGEDQVVQDLLLLVGHV